MRETVEKVSLWVHKYKVLVAILLVFMSGALVSVGLVVSRYEILLDRQSNNYRSQIDQLTVLLEDERGYNRIRLEQIAHDLQSNTEKVSQLMQWAEILISETDRAAVQAKKAAEKASEAAQQLNQSSEP